ncbi:MAG TPA: class I mannose-6-phosphate isomerase [Verrucomicrobiae bacterium]|nr:class I mannose-6-phosphate isomerase [Verrucomicrobiae bacterium]
MRTSTYDKFPFVQVPDGEMSCVQGWGEITARLRQAIHRRVAKKTVLVVECYTGVEVAAIAKEIRTGLAPTRIFQAEEALLGPDQIDALVAPFLGGKDPVFGFLSGLTLPQFFDQEKLSAMRTDIANISEGLVLIVGCGGSLLAEPDVLVYADLARWEAQLRFRRNETSNLGVENRSLAASLQYKRAFFVDWRVCDRWKRTLIGRWDFVLDTNNPHEPKLAEGEAVRCGLRHVVTRPFRVVPFFDPAPWGGQWMKEFCGLDRAAENFGWCFDCVPEENSLLLGFGDKRLEIPSLDLVFHEPRALLGEGVHARFGDEFPIRFDFLDTIGGSNLSFQVHPLTEYIQHHFGMHYTQDESYYVLDSKPGASVYLGLKDGVDPVSLVRDLREAQTGAAAFPADKYANRFPARKHDHFLIPAGTVHCSGAETMVLEISATPYIFTFKMWDWQRLGLDGKPRPIHLEHGVANIQWNQTTDWTRKNLVNRTEPLGNGDGWREERTGLHEREFIETRRHWFTKAVPHDTGGNVNVLNLVEGEEAVVESPTEAFEPFVVHYAETFIVPAAVGRYTIRPHGRSEGRECATMKAFVRPGFPKIVKRNVEERFPESREIKPGAFNHNGNVRVAETV